MVWTTTDPVVNKIVQDEKKYFLEYELQRRKCAHTEFCMFAVRSPPRRQFHRYGGEPKSGDSVRGVTNPPERNRASKNIPRVKLNDFS